VTNILRFPCDYENLSNWSVDCAEYFRENPPCDCVANIFELTIVGLCEGAGLVIHALDGFTVLKTLPRTVEDVEPPRSEAVQSNRVGLHIEYQE